VRGHLLDDSPRAFPQFLRFVALAGRSRDKEIDTRLNSNLPLLAWGRAGLLDHDSLRGSQRQQPAGAGQNDLR
jgi:hypothetical protein